MDDDCDGTTDEGFSTSSAPRIGTASSGAVGGAVNATARWNGPLTDGGLAITGYKVQAQKLNAAGTVVSRVTKTVGPAARSSVVRLAAGRYKFRIAAVNAAGRAPGQPTPPSSRPVDAMLDTNHRRSRIALLLTTTVVAGSLGPAAWAAGSLDQEQPGVREGILMVFAGRDNAQSFVAGRTGRLDRVDLRLAQNVGPDSAEQVAVRIQGAEGYFAVPTSQVLSETSVAATDVTPDYGWTSVELSEPVSVVEGQSYAIVLSATVKDIEAFAWAYTEHEAYAGGIASMITTTDEDPGWGHRIDQDMNFRTYVDAGIDADDDGFGTFQECDDTDPAVNPDAAETYNQVDDDCDEEVDEGFTVAGAPGIGSALSGTTGGVVNATARWTRPTSNGGLPITGYKVQAQKLNAAGVVVTRVTKTTSPAARSLVVKLTAGRYKFRVAALNAAGPSAWSANSAIVRAR